MAVEVCDLGCRVVKKKQDERLLEEAAGGSAYRRPLRILEVSNCSAGSLLFTVIRTVSPGFTRMVGPTIAPLYTRVRCFIPGPE